MKSARSKLFFLFLLLGILWSFQSFAAETNPEADQLKSDISDIKTRLTSIEEQQKEIIAKEGNILEELDRVRIWVHRK